MLISFKQMDGQDVWINSAHVVTVGTHGTRTGTKAAEVRFMDGSSIRLRDDAQEVVEAFNRGMVTVNGGHR